MDGATRIPRRGPRREGQVLIIALLAITLLVSLIFYVYNVGDQVNERAALQNTADAVAVSGGGWLARSMNVIAANNVTQTRLMALALTLDSLPVSAEMTVAEETYRYSLPECLGYQLQRGLPHTKYERQDFLRKGLQEIYDQMNRDLTPEESTHLEFIMAIDAHLDQKNERSLEDVWDVRAATEWYPEGRKGDAPDGTIWQAIIALDEWSQAAYASAGVIAQRNAVRFGRANQAASFMTPILPRVPAVRGTFWDFKPPFLDHLKVWETHAEYRESRVVETLKASPDVLKDIEKVHARGGAIPNWAYPHRLGPFARCYHWRHYWHYRDGPWWEGHEWYRRGYTTYGPLENAIWTVLGGFGLMGSHGGLAFTSRMPFHLRRVSTLKLAYMFGLESPKEIQYADKWITKYEEAERFVEEGVTVDNQGFGFRAVGNWQESPIKYEHAGSSLEATAGGSTATFMADLPAPGGWRIEAYWGGANPDEKPKKKPKDDDDDDERKLDKSAQFTISYRGGVTVVTRDQNNGKGKWNSLGTYNFDRGMSTVVLRRGSTSGPTIADAVRWVPVSLAKRRRPSEQRDKEQVVLRTRYYRVGVTSSVHWDHGDWLDCIRSTYSLPAEQQIRFHSNQLHDGVRERGTNVGDPKQQPLYNWAWEPDGWRPEPGRGKNWQKLMDHVWIHRRVNYRVIDYEPFWWPPRPILDQAGNIIGYHYYTLYHYSWYVWGGIEIRDPVVISNPLDQVTEDQLTAPILLDTRNGDYTPNHDEGFRRRYFTVMGTARRGNQAAVWPARFSRGNPSGSILALSQAEIFNNRSFDLWTQEWRVQLVPLTGWEDWQDRIDEGLSDVSEIGGELEADEVESVRQYLNALPATLAEEFRTH